MHQDLIDRLSCARAALAGAQTFARETRDMVYTMQSQLDAGGMTTDREVVAMAELERAATVLTRVLESAAAATNKISNLVEWSLDTLNGKLNAEEIEILNHARYKAAGGMYCGDGPDMRNLVARGYMRSCGHKSFVPDEYFTITDAGREKLATIADEKLVEVPEV